MGAWEMTLIAEPDAPVIYAELADAWIRQEDSRAAIDVLHEARLRWPDESRFVQGLARARALIGDDATALTELDAHLGRHPDDHEALFLAMRVLHDASSAGRPTGPPHVPARERMAAYARAYEAAGGERLEAVRAWIALFEADARSPD